MKPVEAGVPADFAVGGVNGLIGGLTGLGGIAVTLWCQFAGGPKDAQRAVFQPVMFATFIMSAISLRVSPAASRTKRQLYLISPSRSDSASGLVSSFMESSMTQPSGS